MPRTPSCIMDVSIPMCSSCRSPTSVPISRGCFEPRSPREFFEHDGMTHGVELEAERLRTSVLRLVDIQAARVTPGQQSDIAQKAQTFSCRSGPRLIHTRAPL